MDFIKNKIIKLSKKEILIIFTLFLYVVINFTAYDNPMIGGGFFYKLSHLILSNNIIFFSSFLLGLFLCAIMIKEDRKFIYPLLIIVIMASLLSEPTYKVNVKVGNKPHPSLLHPYSNAIAKGNPKKIQGLIYLSLKTLYFPLEK